MKPLNLPSYEVRLNDDGSKIFDIIRRKYVELTPEEWVRQHFINYLTQHLNYPGSLMKVEFTIKYNQLKKRPDIVIYNRDGKPSVIVECKSSDVRITQDAFTQASVYNKTLNAPYLIITNGQEHFCVHQDFTLGKFNFLKEIPDFNSIIK